MTTPNEREAVIAEMREEAAVQIKTVWIDRATFDRWIAALTREQREVPPGLYDLDPYVLPQQEAPSEQREGVVTFAVDDVRFDVPASIAEKVAAKLAPADNLPQPETPGAVAWTSKSSIDSLTDDCGALIASKGRSDYRNIPVYVGTPPAPVDVRALRALLERMAAHVRPTCSELYDEARALLDGQQAGVDDAMVERAMEAADQVFAEKFGSRPVADETDTAMMRAALQAALGGGGRG